MPVWEVGACTDGGRTLQTVQSTWSRHGGRFVDVDGDGDLDRVLDRTGLFEGGLREMLNRALTRTSVTHELLVYRQDANGRFDDTPAFRWRGDIELGDLPWRRGDMVRAYFDGETINTIGDYNGDGRADLLVRDRPTRLAVHLAGGEGYSVEPDATIRIPRRILSINVIDVDGDRRSDVLVLPENANTRIDNTEVGRTQVYFAREARP
jgi:hypothetical protein